MSYASQSWQDTAACRGEEITLFFPGEDERQPERDARERKAKAVCAGCPVRVDCLNYAVASPEKYGTWGGLNEDERSAERRRRMRLRNLTATPSSLQSRLSAGRHRHLGGCPAAAPR